MVDCYGKSRSVIYDIIIRVLPYYLWVFDGIVCGAKKKTPKSVFLPETSRIATEKLQETSQRVLPLQQKRGCWLQRLGVTAFLQLRNCWWLRDVGFFHGFYSTSFEHPWNFVMSDVYLCVCHGRSKPRLLLQKVWSYPL